MPLNGFTFAKSHPKKWSDQGLQVFNLKINPQVINETWQKIKGEISETASFF